MKADIHENSVKRDGGYCQSVNRYGFNLAWSSLYDFNISTLILRPAENDNRLLKTEGHHEYIFFIETGNIQM